MINRLESKWYNLIDCINSCVVPVNGQLTIDRQFLLSQLDSKGYDKTSIDTYRNYLCKAGFLRQTSIRGYYVLKTSIPSTLTLRECKRLAYPKYYEEKKKDI